MKQEKMKTLILHFYQPQFMNKLSQFIALFKTSRALKNGYLQFKNSGQTSPEAYTAMRNMFVLTKGKSNDQLSDSIAKETGVYSNIAPEGILDSLSEKQIDNSVKELKENGYCVFDVNLSDEQVNQIVHFAMAAPAKYVRTDSSKGQYSDEKVIFNPAKPISPRYQFENATTIDNPVIQSLVFDQSLLNFAQKYLGVKPIMDLIAFWWSAPFGGVGLSEAAQMYHFDLDRIKFMKFFFYLTDVDSETGPHCYVKGSHKRLHDQLARDGRYTDEEVENAYGEQNMIEICGRKGSIIAVDTRGLHKGKELTKDKRLLFQIEFANSMFGQTYPLVPIKFLDKKYEELYHKYQYTFDKTFKVG